MKVRFPLFGRQDRWSPRQAAAAEGVARRASAASMGLLLLLFCLAVAVVLAAGSRSAIAVEPATDVGGPITVSETWTPAGSPYVVTETVIIQADAVLVIQPGVEVDFDAGTGLHVADGGRLVAVGTAADPITFTAHTASPAPGSWERIFFDDTSLASTLRYCVVEYASTAVAIGDTDSHTIDHCTLRYNGDDTDATSGGAINAVGDVLAITNNLIYDNELGLLLRKSYNDTITGNSIYDNDGFGIGFFAENAPGGGDNLIADNDVHGNGDFGIGFLAQGDYEGGDGNVIDGNTIYANGGDGLILDGSDYTLDGGDDNLVLNNRIYENDGHGVWIKNQEGLSLTENVVRANGGNGLTFAIPSRNPDALHSNVLCNNVGYELQNLGSTTITAEGNWFGTNTPGAAEINGLVDYNPWIRMEVSLLPNLLPADGISTATLTLTMNDGAGHMVPDGYTVTVAASQGTVTPAALILNSGQATATYTASTVPGLVEFQATDGCTTIRFTAELELQAVDLAIDKVGPGGITHPGELVTYTVVISEVNGVDARQVVITDTLPAGATWVSDTSSACGLVRQSTPGGVVWTKALWEGGTDCEFSVTVQVNGDACQDETLVNGVEITSATTDIDLSNNSATTGIDSPAIICLDLAIDKFGPGGTTHPGASVTYTVVISEVNGVDAQQVVITDTLSAGATWVSDTSSTCGLVRQATTPGVVWTKALWTGGTRCEFEVTVRVGDNACRDETLVNGVEITSATTDINLSNNSATTGIDSPAILCLNLAVTKDDGQGAVPILWPDKVYVITYTITFSNAGAVDASGVILTDTLPAGTQVYDSNGWTCTGGACTWLVGGLPMDARRTAPPLVVQLLDCGDLRNEVAIGDDGSQGPDYDPADNTFAITTTVPCLPDLRVVKNDNVGPIPKLELAWITDLLDLAPSAVDQRLCVRPGELITYHIAYANTGMVTATQVVLTETLPEYTSYVGGGWTCVAHTCTLSVAGLGPGEGGAADFIVRVDAAPPDLLVLNEVRIGSAEPDADPTDNVSTDDTPICEICLQVRKDADVPCAFPGDEIHYTIVFTNTCDLPASGVVLTDTLPDYTSHPPIAAWTPVAGDQFTYDYGPLPAHSSDSVEFVVVVDNSLPPTVTATVNEVCIGRDRIAGAEDCDTEITPLPLEADLRVVKHDHIGLPPPDTRQQLDRFYQALYGHPYQPSKIQQELEPVKPGDVFSYTITYLNLGRAPATGVVLTETLPARTTYVGYVWTPAGGNVYTYTVGDLGVGMGGQVDFWVQVNPSACGTGDYLYNWAYIGGNEQECNLGNNWSGEETPVELPACAGTVYLPLLMKDYTAPVEPTPTPPPSMDGYVSDVAVNPGTNRVYVASPSQDAVFAVVSPTDEDPVIDTIAVGDHPSGLAVVTTTNKIYAANFGSHNVTAIDGNTHTPIINITVGVEPCKVAADSGDARVYVTHHKEIDNGAAAINSQTDERLYYYTRMHATQARYGIDVDPDPAHEKLFIAARDAGLIAIQAAYYPGADPQVLKLDPARVPFVVAFNPTTAHLFVTADDPNLDDDVVVVLDPYSIQWTRGTWVTMRGRQVFLLSRTNAGWIKEIGVGQGAEEGIAVNPLTGYVYVTNADDDTVSILRDDPDTANIVWIKDLPVGDRPQGVDVDILRNLIYVGNSLSRDLTVIDGATNTFVKTIPLY